MNKAVILLVLTLLISNNQVIGQQDMSSIEKLFENKDDVDMIVVDLIDVDTEYGLYLSEGIVYCSVDKKSPTFLALDEIDFAKCEIIEDWMYNFRDNGNKVYVFELFPRAGKSSAVSNYLNETVEVNENIKLYFPTVDEATLALDYLKHEAKETGSDNTQLELTDSFSFQLSLIICNWKNEFEELKGDKLLESSDLLYKSTLQLEGGINTEIKLGSVVVDFGRFMDKDELSRIFYQLKEQIQKSEIICCTLTAAPEEGTKEIMFAGYSQKWSTSNVSDEELKDLVVELSISAFKISLSIGMDSGDEYGDDEEGW